MICVNEPCTLKLFAILHFQMQICYNWWPAIFWSFHRFSSGFKSDWALIELHPFVEPFLCSFRQRLWFIRLAFKNALSQICVFPFALFSCILQSFPMSLIYCSNVATVCVPLMTVWLLFLFYNLLKHLNWVDTHKCTHLTSLTTCVVQFLITRPMFIIFISRLLGFPYGLIGWQSESPVVIFFY